MNIRRQETQRARFSLASLFWPKPGLVSRRVSKILCDGPASEEKRQEWMNVKTQEAISHGESLSQRSFAQDSF
jgi:hypothetical protein